MLSSGADLRSLFTWGHQALTGEIGMGPSHPMDGVAENVLPQAHFSTWVLIAKGTEVVWEVAGDDVCWSVRFMLQLKHSLQGKMAA